VVVVVVVVGVAATPNYLRLASPDRGKYYRPGKGGVAGGGRVGRCEGCTSTTPFRCVYIYVCGAHFGTTQCYKNKRVIADLTFVARK
jgi:hypothetical protein